MLTKDEVLAALATVKGADGGASLVESGALSDVLITGGRVTFSITGDPARSVELEAVRLAAERAVKALQGVETVLVTLTAEPAVVLMIASPRASVPPPVTFRVKAPLTKRAPLVTVSVWPELMVRVLLPPSVRELIVLPAVTVSLADSLTLSPVPAEVTEVA